MDGIRLSLRVVAAACLSFMACLSFAASNDPANVAAASVQLGEPEDKDTAVAACPDAKSASDESLKLELQNDKNAAGPCSPDGFPSGVGNPINCCQEGNRTYHTNDGRTLVYRIHAAPCTEADGVGTNCGVGSSPFVQCVYGPCGARIEWAVTAEEVHVFVPVSRPGKCGWEVKNVIECRVGCDWPAGAVRQYPEPFVSQVQYPGVTATCPYRNCHVGGIPVP